MDIERQRSLHRRARLFRKLATPAEHFLWQHIKDKQISDLRIRRQFPIDRYIADFCCITKKLVIEIDGPIHETTQERDKNRELILRYYGYTVIRFTNEQVLHNVQDVIAVIKKYLNFPSSPERR